MKLAHHLSLPNQVWVAEIKVLKSDEAQMYLAVTLCAWGRRLLSFACAPTLPAPLVIASLQTDRYCNAVLFPSKFLFNAGTKSRPISRAAQGLTLIKTFSRAAKPMQKKSDSQSMNAIAFACILKRGQQMAY